MGETGSLTNQRLFVEPGESEGRTFFPDGMTVDRFGNLYVADLALSGGVETLTGALEGGKVRVWNSDGEEILAFEPPDGAVNMTFAPEGSNTLYFTSAASLYRVELDLVSASTCTPLNALEGDFDGDGTVGFPDFLVLSENFGRSVEGYSSGDITCDGTVGFDDFLALSENFGESLIVNAANATTQSVPEPASVALVLAALLGVLRIRPRRRLPMRSVDEGERDGKNVFN